MVSLTLRVERDQPPQNSWRRQFKRKTLNLSTEVVLFEYTIQIIAPFDDGLGNYHFCKWNIICLIKQNIVSPVSKKCTAFSDKTARSVTDNMVVMSWPHPQTLHKKKMSSVILRWYISCHCWHHKQDGFRWFPRNCVSLLYNTVVHLEIQEFTSINSFCL